jgi:biopolymer transport protein ExbB/TolQ
VRLGLAGFVRLSREEPFRIFFPLGLIFAATGVALWPLFFLGAVSFYPATRNSRAVRQQTAETARRTESLAALHPIQA